MHCHDHIARSPTVGLCSILVGLLAAPRLAVPEEQIEVSTPAGTVHEMMLVPAGSFTMGSGVRDQRIAAHEVYLDTFYIDKFEVTNGRYLAFAEVTGRDYSRYYGGPYPERFAGDDKPVNIANWEDADAYCRWAGLRLPTEAEWEKAARGTDGRVYPWGDEPLDRTRANYGFCPMDFCLDGYGGVDEPFQPPTDPYNVGNDGYKYTAPVGSYAAGVSPYGAHDMIGNVWEWVQDWYEPFYYARSPAANPTGPATGTDKVVRGLSWLDWESELWEPTHMSAVWRGYQAPWRRWEVSGFRCAAEVGVGAGEGPGTGVDPRSWGTVKQDVPR